MRRWVVYNGLIMEKLIANFIENISGKLFLILLPKGSYNIMIMEISDVFNYSQKLGSFYNGSNDLPIITPIFIRLLYREIKIHTLFSNAVSTNFISSFTLEFRIRA